MSEELRSMLLSAAALEEDEVSFDSISQMAMEFRCESTRPIDDTVAPDAPRAMRELVDWCKERIAKSGHELVPVIRAAHVAAVRSTAHLELWISRRCGAMRRGGYFNESAELLARCAPATSLQAADWSDADVLAGQPWLLESIDGNVAGVIFNHTDKFNGFGVRDVLHAWALSLALNASRERDVGRSIALMCEACQALNYAGFMDGWEGGEETGKESGTKTAASEFAREAARKAAHAKHAENRSMKAQVLDWYAKHGTEFSSKDDAAIEAARSIVPVKFRTVRDWLSNASS